jgi:transposase
MVLICGGGSCVLSSAGGSKVEAAKRFGVARKTVYNY